MGSGLGSMSKLTNRMGQRVGGGGAVSGCSGGVAVKKMIEKDLIWELLVEEMQDKPNFDLQFFFYYPGTQLVEEFTYFPASPNPPFKICSSAAL